jgi:hypothetical protein
MGRGEWPEETTAPSTAHISGLLSYPPSLGFYFRQMVSSGDYRLLVLVQSIPGVQPLRWGYSYCRRAR